MTSLNMTRLNDMVRIAAPGSTDGMIRMEMYNTLKEFFQRTDAWLFEVPVYIVPDSNDYQIDTGQNVVVNRLLAVERPQTPPPPNGSWPPSYVPMCPPQYLQVSENSAYYEGQNPMFRVRRWGVLLNAGVKCPVMRITFNPNDNETWIATFSLNITDPTDDEGFTDPPEWILEKWLNYLASGVVSKLMIQPGKPYSSVQGMQYHGRKFNEGVGLARTEIRHMLTYGSQRWSFPQGWNAVRPRLPSGQMR